AAGAPAFRCFLASARWRPSRSCMRWQRGEHIARESPARLQLSHVQKSSFSFLQTAQVPKLTTCTDLDNLRVAKSLNIRALGTPGQTKTRAEMLPSRLPRRASGASTLHFAGERPAERPSGVAIVATTVPREATIGAERSG